MNFAAIVRHGIRCLEFEFHTDKPKGGGTAPLQSGVGKNHFFIGLATKHVDFFLFMLMSCFLKPF